MRIDVTIVKIHNALIGAGLCLTATAAAALSLGPAHGTVVLGSVVDLRFDVTPGAGSSDMDACVTAQLVGGSSALPAGRVQVTPITAGGRTMVRVQTLDPVMEPILEVTLSAGCQGRVTRTYTFLAQLPSNEPALAQPPSAVSSQASRSWRVAAANVTSLDEAPAKTGRATSAGAGERTRAQSVRPARHKERVPRTAPQEQAQQHGAAAPAAEATKARLVMEPLDLTLPPAPASLQLTRELPGPVDPASTARRAEAATAWRALNQSAEELQRFDARLDKLEADARTWRTQIEAERAANAQLRQHLAQLQATSFPATLVYALVGLLLLVLAWSIWLLRRSAQATQAAWRQAVEHGTPLDSVAQDTAYVPTQGQTWAPSMQVQAEDAAEPQPQATFSVPVASTPAPLDVVLPSVAPPAPSSEAQQIVQPEALFDTLQQAEFFISVGEHEHAIAVLQQHIVEHGETSPVAYLELLRLLHSLGRAQDFAQQATHFQQRFNIRLPAFARFHEQGRSLFGYPQVLATIEEQWPSDQVLQTLGNHVFRAERRLGTQLFDPAAFEDLLLLLSIAQTVPAQQRGVLSPRTRTTPLEPAQDEGAPSFDSLAAGLALLPSGHMPLAADKPIVEAMLDVDLSEILPPDVPAPGGTQPAQPAPVGFGMNSDRFEASFELEELDRRKGGGR